MKLVITLVVIFAVSFLGGWFGYRLGVVRADENASFFGFADAREQKDTGGGSLAAGTMARLDEMSAEVSDLGRAMGERVDKIEGQMAMLREETSGDRGSDLYKARLEEDDVVLTDRKGRVVRVEILSVGNEIVSVRRVIDSRKFDIPFDRLREEDQDFLEYVETRGGFARNDSGLSPGEPEEVDLDAIFNSFGN